MNNKETDPIDTQTSKKGKLSTLYTPISPPPTRTPSLSAIEAGQETTPNPLETISTHLAKHILPQSQPRTRPLLSINDLKSLYERNVHKNGHHFVIHQHDHPIAGPHYDLRLQFSESSSLSWSVMYGLPGDANSRRLNRNATETRVHCLWNHLIETASAKTGSMIIWDTGVYEVLPDRPRPGRSGMGPKTETEAETDENEEDARTEVGARDKDTLAESEKLRRAFQNHKIHLRLHGTRLPDNYTIFLGRDKSEFRSPSMSRAPRKRKRKRGFTKNQLTRASNTDTDTNSEFKSKSGSGSRGMRKEEKDDKADSDAEEVDYQIRLKNAYPGATNDIGSVHQRRWFITLDRVACGFVAEKESDSGKRQWVRGWDAQTGGRLGFEPFYVRGPEVERSVVTGRLGRDVLRDEGVERFIPRRGWNPVLF